MSREKDNIMKKIILNFENCLYISEIHKTFKTAFDLPDHYGDNWDALWDCLDGWFLGEGKVIVEIQGLSSLKNELRRGIEPMFSIFKEVSYNTPNVKFIIVS